MLSKRYSDGNKSSAPTFENIMRFGFEFILRYDGEKALKSASKEELEKTKHILAGLLLLYLGGEPGMNLDGWRIREIKALVDKGVLTKEEVQPLMNARSLQPGDGEYESAEFAARCIDANPRELLVSPYQISEKDRQRLALSAYRRFYLGGMFPRDGLQDTSWEERPELLRVLKVVGRLTYAGGSTRQEIGERSRKFTLNELLAECQKDPDLRSLHEEKLKNLVGRVIDLGLLKTNDETQS